MDEKILALIRNKEDNYVSGEELSKELHISRAGIWKHIEKLRREGYVIEAVPHLGYKFVSAPDRLISTEVIWNLNTKIFGKKIYSFKKTDSTNTIAYKFAENGEQEGAVVFAEEQTGGRGRFNRKWASPEGGIYMSVILRPDMEPIKTAQLTLMTAISVAEAIRKLTNLPALIKWPNDILIHKKKVCGILTEMKAEQDNTAFVIIGIGINVNIAKKDLPEGATSIKEELKTNSSKVNLARLILIFLEANYKAIKSDFSAIIGTWRNLSDTLGRRVKVYVHGETSEGQALDVDDNGGLIVRLDSGFTKHVLSGDVELVR